MLKNKIKAMKIGFLIVCILPNISYAFDKEDLLKFLVRSSYPEVKVMEKNEDDNENNNNEEDKSNDKTTESSNDTVESEVKEDEYVNIYVGEENIPNKSEKESSTDFDTNYSNDLRVTKNDPQILIYHTHSSETYSDSPSNNYHSQDKQNSVLAVGDELTTNLSNRGWGVVHSTTYNDLNYNSSYSSSLKTAQSILSQYNSVKITIDLHRDGSNIKSESAKKELHDKYTTEINGETVAKFFLVVGQRNENVSRIKKEADEITALAQEKYPGLVCEVVQKPYGKFNQYMTDNSMLIEVGNNATSVKEAKASCKYIAEILDEYYKSKL